MKTVSIEKLMEFEPKELLEGLRTNHIVKFQDGVEKQMSSKEIIVQRYIMELWKIVPSLKMTSEYCISNFYTNGIYNSKTINKCFEVILKNVIETFVKTNNDNRDILEVLWNNMSIIVSDIYNDILSVTNDYVDTINIVDLLEIQLDPRLMDAIKNADRQKTPEAINKTYDVLDDIIRNDPKYKNNTVAIGYISTSINPNQAKQVLGSRGYITDIDGTIYKTPATSSFTLGMQDLYSLSIESRAAPKALTANNIAVPTSEYFSRELQLLTMYQERLVDGDCGNTDYINWAVRGDMNGKSDLVNLEGKRFLNEETGQEEVITLKHKHLEGKTIKLRTVLNCKLKNKRHVCTRCFGELAYSIPKHDNIGHVCAGVIGQAITQNILKTKHHTGSALTAPVVLDNEAAKVFNIKSKLNYHLNQDIFSGREIRMIIDQEQAFGLKDITEGIDILKLNPNRISRLMNIIIELKDNKTHKLEYIPINIKDGNKYGSFTYEFMQHVIKYGYILDNQDRYVVDITKFGYKLPIISMPEIEYNLLHLVVNLRAKLRSLRQKKKTMERETPESLLQELFDLLNSKLDIKLPHLEIVTTSFCVQDLENGNFDLNRKSSNPLLTSNEEIVSHRSLGNGYGWERIINLIVSPNSFYGKNNISHPLDVLIKPVEVLKYEPDLYKVK